MKKIKKEKMSKAALDHSFYGTFTKNSKNGQLKMKSGGHGRGNFDKLESAGINYEITKQYPNGVMIGKVERHSDKGKRIQSGQSWFPKTWSRRKVKKSAEKLANSAPYKLPDGKIMYGRYDKMKIGMIRTNGKIATVFPLTKQSGGKKNDQK